MILEIIGVIIGLLVIGFSLLYFGNSKKELIEPDTTPLLINHMKKNSEGHAFLKVVDMDILDRRIKIIAYPRDLNRKKMVDLSKKNQKLKPYTLFFDKTLVDFKPDFSDYIPILEAYPQKISHLCESDKKDKKIIERINQSNRESDATKLYDERLKALTDIGMNLAGGKLFNKYQSSMQELHRDKMGLNVERERKDEK